MAAKGKIQLPRTNVVNVLEGRSVEISTFQYYLATATAKVKGKRPGHEAGAMGAWPPKTHSPKYICSG